MMRALTHICCRARPGHAVAACSPCMPAHPCPAQAYEARRAARDAEREAQQAAQEEEIRRAAEERARREEEEAQKWMHLFSVEAAGEEALSQDESAVRAARRAWGGGVMARGPGPADVEVHL